VELKIKKIIKEAFLPNVDNISHRNKNNDLENRVVCFELDGHFGKFSFSMENTNYNSDHIINKQFKDLLELKFRNLRYGWDDDDGSFNSGLGLYIKMLFEKYKNNIKTEEYNCENCGWYTDVEINVPYKTVKPFIDVK
jgi:hypothetical protein